MKLDEVSSNEIAADIMKPIAYINLPPYDKDVYKRIHLKVKEFDKNICTESDEAIREEKWQNWAKQEEQVFLSMNKIDDFEFLDQEDYEKKVRFD